MPASKLKNRPPKLASSFKLLLWLLPINIKKMHLDPGNIAGDSKSMRMLVFLSGLYHFFSYEYSFCKLFYLVI